MAGLHVAHVVLSLDVGGLERNVVNQIRVASRSGRRTSVICVERRGVLWPTARDLGADLICLDKRPGLSLVVVSRMRAALMHLRPDVIHTHQIGPLFYTGLAKVGLRIPLLVHTEHGRVDYAGRLRLRWLGRIAAARSSLFYCLSQDMADAVTQRRIVARDKLRVIRNGIDTAAFRENGHAAETRASLDIPLDAPVVGTVGRLNEIKRQEVLLRAFARLLARVENAYLLLVGDGPRRTELEALAQDLGIANRVRFAGYHPSSAPFLHAMNVFALTSRSEGTPQALLEASVAGVPVIASAVGGIPEVVADGRTGLLFPSGDDGALAEGLHRLLSDRELAATLTTAAREHVEAHYSVDRMAAEYDADFHERLANQCGRKSSEWQRESLARA